jgi:hypothetical protein
MMQPAGKAAVDGAMPSLHLTRVAFGCADLAALERGFAARALDGEIFFTTRNRPRRAEELIGGHLHFIIRHTLVARAQILRFDEAGEGWTNIVCTAWLEPVMPTPRRAHQGWRYLEEKDAPPLLDANSGVDVLPPELARALSSLALI